MRKIICIVLAVGLLVCLSACKDDSENPANPSQPNVVEVPGTSVNDPESTTAPTVATNADGAQTMVLTTAPGMVMPTEVTTQFTPIDPSGMTTDLFTTIPGTTDFTFTQGPIEVPSVNTSQISTTKPITTEPTNPSGEKPGKSEPTSGDVTSNTRADPQGSTKPEPTGTQAKAITVTYNDVCMSGNKLVYAIDKYACGVEKFKANTTSVTVKVDGVSYKGIYCRVNATRNADGLQIIVLDTSSIEAVKSSGANISAVIPSGFLISSDGNYYNRSITVNYTVVEGY